MSACAVGVAFLDPAVPWELALIVAAWSLGGRSAAVVAGSWGLGTIAAQGLSGTSLAEVGVTLLVAGAVCALIAMMPRPMTRLRQAWFVLGALGALSAVTVALIGSAAGQGEAPRAVVGVFAVLSLGAAISWWGEGRTPRPALCAPLLVASLTAFAMLATAQVLRYRDVEALEADAARIAATFAAEHEEHLEVIAAEAAAASDVPLAPDNFADRMRPVLSGHAAISSVVLVEIDADGHASIVAEYDNGDGVAAGGLAEWLQAEHDNSGDHHSSPGVADYIDIVELPSSNGDRSTHFVHAGTAGSIGTADEVTVLYAAISATELLRAAAAPTLLGSGGASVTLSMADGAATSRVAFIDAIDDSGVLVEVPTDDPEMVGAASVSVSNAAFELLVRPSVGYGLSHSTLRLVLVSLGFVGLVGYVTLAQRRISGAAADEVLQRRQALLDAALAGSRGWSAVVDTDLRVRIANDHELGVSEGELLTDAPAIVGDEHAAERVRQMIVQAQSDGSATASVISADDRGRTRIVDVVATLLPATGDERLCFVQFVDVTTERERAMRAAQADRMEAIGAMAGGVAHDFNNLLFITLGYLQLMERHAERQQDSTLASYVTPAIDAVRRGAEVTKALLTASGQHPVNERAVDVGEFVRELAPLIEQSVGKAVSVRYSLDDGASALVDTGSLSGVLLNLCANARHALQGRSNPLVEVVVRRQDGDAGVRVVIEVRDNGVGMPPDVAARAFEPFFTTRPRGQGTGLGLASVFAFGQRSGGSVRLDSAEGVGTAVVLDLPGAVLDEAAGREAARTRPIERALVVDDEAEIAELVASWLEPLVDVVKVASSPTIALDIAAQFEPQLLVCDANLNHAIDGLEVARRVLEGRPETVVVFMTGFAERVRELETTGAITLAKPFSQDDLIVQLRRCGVVPADHVRERDTP